MTKGMESNRRVQEAWQGISDKQDENFRRFMKSLNRDVVRDTMKMKYDTNLTLVKNDN